MVNSGVNEQCYICCQAPLPTTITDFWRMIWQHHCSVIVMLTNLVEQKKVKAHVYWPSEEGETLTYGNMYVKLVQERQRSQGRITVRTFQIGLKEKRVSGDSSSDSADEEQVIIGDTLPVKKMIEVTHLHFTNWPDFGVPKETQFFKDLLKEVEIRRQEKEPIVVHCSAGIGRTGTFVAIHISMLQHLLGRDINIKETVLHLRSQRMGMVQSPEQYNFIYASVADIIKEQEKLSKMRKRVRRSLPPQQITASDTSEDGSESDDSEVNQTPVKQCTDPATPPSSV